MSDISDIVDAIIADLGTAVSGINTSKNAVQPDALPDEDFPLAEVLQTDYDIEPLDWGQENRIWTVSIALFEVASKQAGDGLGTRDTMETKLEAVRDQIAADNTLGGTCDRALCGSIVPESHPDASRIGGAFVVIAEKVA